MYSTPLVSVGIPTYNRTEMLRRAVESVLAQDYLNLEVVISDNASTDGTQALCQDLCLRDERVHYIRQSTNKGPIANHHEVFRRSNGELFMYLGDDDWLDPSYVSQCVSALLEQPELALVTGVFKWYRDRTLVHEGVRINLVQESGRDRVLAHYKQVRANELFHGVGRRDLLMKVQPMSRILGFDSAYMASIAFMGKVKTLESTAVNKSFSENYGDGEKIARSLGLPMAYPRFWYLYFTISAFSDIAWVSPAYKGIGHWARFALACQASLLFLCGLSVRSIPRPLLRLLKSWWYQRAVGG
jgi:glycosyltransferase involved in cell wall biosynthesis